MKATKALKPSKMGLHSTIRFTVEPEGENRLEQEKNIINYVTSLHEFLQSSGIPEEQSEIFTWNFARRRQVLVILAAHPTKMKLDPLTKKFPVPTMYDISGSAAFFNKADFGIAIERDRGRGVTRVHVQKVKFRHLGYPGVASFQYNLHCGRFVPIQESSSPDLPDIVPDYDNSNWLGKKEAKMNRLEFEE